MNYYLARQPIFDKKQKLFGYELLFRDSLDNFFPSQDPDQATLEVVTNSILHSTINSITFNKKAFINFTKNLILKKVPLLLPKQIVVVELLENIEPDKEFIKTLSEIKEKGYKIVIDDFFFQENLTKLIEYADIIKVDFMEVDDDEKKSIVKEFKREGLEFLAEKVETIDEFRMGLQAGYSYFQGYFFSKPQIVKGKKLPANKLVYISLINEANKEDIDFNTINDILKKDVSLTVKLLKYVNSPFFGFRFKIESLKHALVLLGENEIRKWISLIAFTNLSGKENIELVRISLIRGKLGELLCNEIKILSNYKEKLFLTGMLSTLDAILRRPIEEIIEEMAISDDIKDALVGRKNLLRFTLDMILSLELGEWKRVDLYCEKFKLEPQSFMICYKKSLEWAEEIVKLM